MNVSKFNWMKWILYGALFVLTAALTLFLFAAVFLFTSLFLWLIIPSRLIYWTITVIALCAFLVLMILAGRKRWHWLTAISLGGSVVPGLMLILMVISPLIRMGQSSHQKPNQRQPVISPSGKYVLTVPIERSKRHKGPLGFGSPYWHVTISDPNGEVVYRDPEEDFPGWFGTYWVWDEEDRVWLFGSDYGTVFYECADGIWTRYQWGSGKTAHVEKDIVPPESLYPDYVSAGSNSLR
jgi:hypothetical protein